MKLIIKRSEWIRGEDAMQSYLRREHDDKKCCLGFLGEQSGIASTLLIGRNTPATLIGPLVGLPKTMAFLLDEDASADSAVCAELMVINDTPVGLTASVNQYNRLHRDFEVSSEELREAKIGEILAAHGISVTFID